MRLLAIDPGPVRSAWMLLDADSWLPVEYGACDNAALVAALHRREQQVDHLAVEMVACYGMPVGAEVFETCLWVGRFLEAWGGPATKVYRRDVKLTLCCDSRAKDGNVRQALIDRYPPTGGGKVPQVGTKQKPGPLYGVRRDVWQALAVAITWAEGRPFRGGALDGQENGGGG